MEVGCAHSRERDGIQVVTIPFRHRDARRPVTPPDAPRV
jgi:hypothetical protein